MRKYDAIYVLTDRLQGEALENACAAIRSVIEESGGVVHEMKQPARRTFARPLKRQQAGYCMEITFELDPAKVHALQESSKPDTNILRVMIVSARKETATEAKAEPQE